MLRKRQKELLHYKGIICVKLGKRGVQKEDQISILGDSEDGSSMNQEIKNQYDETF